MSLFSWDYETAHLSEDWFLMAHAYADASVTLFESMANKSLPETFHHGKVAAAVFIQGLELFLKGALVQAGEKKPKNTHELAGLFQKFLRRYPGETYGFSGRVTEAVQSTPALPTGQWLRYPADVEGKPWPGNFHFIIPLWIEQVRAFRDDYRRLEPLLKVAYPGPQPK